MRIYDTQNANHTFLAAAPVFAPPFPQAFGLGPTLPTDLVPVAVVCVSLYFVCVKMQYDWSARKGSRLRSTDGFQAWNTSAVRLKYCNIGWQDLEPSLLYHSIQPWTVGGSREKLGLPWEEAWRARVMSATRMKDFIIGAAAEGSGRNGKKGLVCVHGEVS